MLADVDPRQVDVIGGDLRRQRRFPQPGREPGELGRADTDLHLWQSARVTRLQRNSPGQVPGLQRHQPDEQGRGLLVCLVLQQTGEQQVSGLEEGEVLSFVLGDRPG